MKVVTFLASGAVFFIFGYWFALSGDKQPTINSELVSECPTVNKASSNKIDTLEISGTEKNKTNAIPTNQHIVDQLQFDLEETKKVLVKKEVQIKNLISEANDYQNNINKSVTPTEKHITIISKEVAETALPKPFSSFFVDATGRRAEEFNRFQNEELDHDWAYIMEIRIKDFIGVHYEATNVDVQSVKCKTTTCEITGFETEEQKVQVILRDMRKESWWEFQNTSSSTSQSTEFGQYFYVSISK